MSGSGGSRSLNPQIQSWLRDRVGAFGRGR